MSTLPIPKQVIIDVLIFLIVCVPLLVFHTLGKPVPTGFWCNDKSLSHPYKPDTVPQSVLLVISFGGPFIVMAVTESIRAAVKTRLPGRIRSEMMSLAKAYGVFLFGIAANCIFTDTLKFSVGRLRPHFFDICRPDFDKINCTAEAGSDSFSFMHVKKEPLKYASDDLTNTLMDTRDLCGDVSKYDALMVVHTAGPHFQHRQNYRDTYGSYDFTQPYRIKEFRIPPPYQQELMFCHVWKLGEVERTGKWGISLEEYELEFYPPYCSGFIVVVMPAIVEDLYHAARSTPFLWLDDVFIYGVVREEMRDVQIVNVDEIAHREEHYEACYQQYGYRCKYWATVLPVGQDLISVLLALRADRIRTLDHERVKRRKAANSTTIDTFVSNISTATAA